jgi:hypothetical protein
MYLGDFKPGAILDFKFNTNKADGTPITLAGTPAVSVYKDNSTTESTAGVTLTVDFDGRTGCHNVRIDTGADGTFYAQGANFHVAITTGTVDSISVVGAVLKEFSIRARSPNRPVEIQRMLKYAVGTATQGKLRFQIPKADGSGYAVAADWTPATGDVKVSLDGAAEANIGTLPAYSNGAWELTLTGAEVTAKRVGVRITDVAPKVIDDLFISIETFGHASALYPDDLTASAGTAQSGDAYAVVSGSTIDGLTLTEALRVALAVLAGKASGVDSGSPVYRAVDDSKARVTATASNGNRTAVTVDET